MSPIVCELILLKCPILHIFAYGIFRTLFCTNPYFSIHYMYRFEARRSLEINAWESTLSILSMTHIFEGIVLFHSVYHSDLLCIYIQCKRLCPCENYVVSLWWLVMKRILLSFYDRCFRYYFIFEKFQLRTTFHILYNVW